MKSKGSTQEDMTKYYNEGPYGPNGEDKSLTKFFHTRWSPGGGGGGCSCAFDQECKGFLKTIKEKIEQGVGPTPIVDPDALRFRGQIDQDPATTPPPWTIDGNPYTPIKNDIVRFGTKEFMYSDKDGWVEIGDETALDWNEI